MHRLSAVARPPPASASGRVEMGEGASYTLDMSSVRVKPDLRQP